MLNKLNRDDKRINMSLGNQQKIGFLAGKSAKIFAISSVLLIVAASQLLAAPLGNFLYNSSPEVSTSPCDGGGISTTTTHTEYYENGRVDVRTNSNCPPLQPTTTRDTTISPGGTIYGKINFNFNDGNIVVELNTGKIEVYDVKKAHKGNPYSTPLIGSYTPNGNSIIAKDIPRNVPLIVVVRDAKGVIISTEKILIED